MWGLLGGIILIFVLSFTSLVIALFVYKYNKRLSFFFGFLAILIVGWFIYYQSIKNESLGNYYAKEFIGTYHLDINKSTIDSTEIETVKDLQLIVKDENSFQFSKPTPFFSSTFGKYQYYSDGEIAYANIFIDKDTMLNILNLSSINWTFEGSIMGYGKKNIKLVFIK